MVRWLPTVEQLRRLQPEDLELLALRVAEARALRAGAPDGGALAGAPPARAAPAPATAPPRAGVLWKAPPEGLLPPRPGAQATVKAPPTREPVPREEPGGFWLTCLPPWRGPPCGIRPAPPWSQQQQREIAEMEAQIAVLEDQMQLANTILREQIRAYRERGAVMVPGEVGEMRADIALLEHQLAATMLHVDLPPLPPWIDIDVTAVGASGGALGSGAGSDMHPCDGHLCWSY